MNPFEYKHGVSFGWHFKMVEIEEGSAISQVPKAIETELHSFRDFGLYPVENGIIIDAPAIAKSGIYVPGMDGEIDTTASLDGIVHYKNRKATFKFKAIDARNSYIETWHTLLRLLHGQEKSIVLDDDPRGYYFGRWNVEKPEPDNKLGVAYFTITGECKPYQYDYMPTRYPWLWYPFRFKRDSIRRNYNAITVSGTSEFSQTIISSELPVVPNITISAFEAHGYTEVVNTTGKNPKEEHWYERSGEAGSYVYTLTTDTTPVDGRTYYQSTLTGATIGYKNIYGDNQTRTIRLWETKNTALFGDLILCSLRKEQVQITIQLIGATSEDWATINIDFETGRL